MRTPGISFDRLPLFVWSVFCYCFPATTITPSISGSNYYAPNRPKSQNYVLRPCRRGRPNPFSTTILVLWPPRSLHTYSPRVRHDLPRHCPLLWEERAIWILRNGLCNSIYRNPWVLSMSAPHVYSRNGRRHTSLLHSSNHDNRRTHRNKGI